MFERARLWAAERMLPAEVRKALDSSPVLSTILGGTSGASSLWGTTRGIPEMLDAYNKMPWLRAAVHKVSQTVGTTTWRLFAAKNARTGEALQAYKFQYGEQAMRRRLIKQAQASGKVELVEIDQHPMLALLNQGSTILPGTTNMKLCQMYIDLVGESIMLKERGSPFVARGGKKIVTGLVPIPPHWLRRLPSTDNMTYGIAFGSGEIEDIPAEDVIYSKDPNPLDPYGRGSGQARVLSDELQANDAATRTIRSRLENDAIPPFIAMPVEGDSAPEADALKRFQAEWNAKLRGPTKKGLVHFLRKRFQFEKLGYDFKELDLVPLLQHQRDTVLQVYGFPPEIFGILQSSNRATISAAEFLYAKYVVQPRLEFNRSVLQQTLVPEFDERLILDFESPVAEDEELEADLIKTLPFAFMVDEIRERGGEEPLPDGKGQVFAVPVSYFMQEDLLDGQPGMGADGTEPGDTGDDETPPEDDPEEPAEEGYGMRARAGVLHERKNEDAAKAQQVANAADEGTVRKGTVPAVKETVIAAGKKRMAELAVGISFDIHDPKVLDLIATFGAQKVRKINNTTRDAIRQTLLDGMKDGDDIGALTRRVRNVFTQASGRRALTIARTESVRAMNGGQLAATQQAGFEGKQWLATKDDRTRDTHIVLDGQIVAVDANFISPSGATGQHPGEMGQADEDINCRCTTLSVAKMPSGSSSLEFDEVEEGKRVRMWRANERQRIRYERAIRAAFVRAFAQQENEVLAELHKVFQ